MSVARVLCAGAHRREARLRVTPTASEPLTEVNEFNAVRDVVDGLKDSHGARKRDDDDARNSF